MHFQVAFQQGYPENQLISLVNLFIRRVIVQTGLLSPSCTVLACWLCGGPDGLIGGLVLSHERGTCLSCCCCQQLCCNCASMQVTGICWIQGGVFSIRTQWNTFSASLVAWWATAKGGSRQYNDAWHNNATVLQPVPRKPHNMCHCVPCFAAWPRCLALAGDTERPGCTVKLIAAGL